MDKPENPVPSIVGLRDYFAGQALVEFASLIELANPRSKMTIAQLCYSMADAMLAARVQP